MTERAELTRVVADIGLAERLIASAKRHLASAEQLSEEDPELAYAAIHDAVRKGDGGDASGTRTAAHRGPAAISPYSMRSEPSSGRPWESCCGLSTVFASPATESNIPTVKLGSTPTPCWQTCPRHVSWSTPRTRSSGT
jgi:hypothetical protein